MRGLSVITKTSQSAKRPNLGHLANRQRFLKAVITGGVSNVRL
jgi:hypothetical protein